MTTPRILKGRLEGERVIVEGEEFFYASKILRLRVGEEFFFRTDDDKEYLVKTEHVDKKSLQGKILQEVHLKNDPFINLSLALGIPEKDTLKEVLFMGTELGVRSFYPLLTNRVQGKIERNLARYEKIIEEAIRVSGRKTIPTLNQPQSLKDFLKNLPAYDLALVFYEESKASLRKVLENRKCNHKCQNLLIFIGPEGGWEREEMELFQAMGIQEVGLGEVIFKVRTAVLAALSLIFYEYGDLG